MVDRFEFHLVPKDAEYKGKPVLVLCINECPFLIASEAAPRSKREAMVVW